MTNAAIQVQNETALPLSIDIKVSEDDTIRELLQPKGTVGGGDSIDVGDRTTFDELNKNTEFRKLLDAAPPKVSLSVVAGSNDIAGSDASTAVPNIDGLGGEISIAQAFIAGSAGASEDRVLVAEMPFAALLLDAQLMVNAAATAGGSGTFRDAIAGGGNALSDNLATTATGRVRDTGAGTAGVVPTIAKGAALVLRLNAQADAAGTAIAKLQRLA